MKRLIIATLCGLLFGFVCFGFACQGKNDFNSCLAISINHYLKCEVELPGSIAVQVKHPPA